MTSMRMVLACLTVAMVTCLCMATAATTEERCSHVECPTISNCQDAYTPPGGCCPVCDCSNQKKQKFGYFWKHQTQPCRICSCHHNIEECESFVCPDQKLFQNCIRAKRNFYCGCKTMCEINGPITPTFPTVPSFD